MLVQLDISWDLSYGKLNTLSSESVRAIEKLNDDVKVLGFYQKEKDLANKENFRLLGRLLRKESSKFNTEIFDADMNPAMVEKYQIKKIPSIVVTSGDKHLTLENWSEEKVVNAATRLLKKEKTSMCLMQGNGEITYKEGESYSLSAWAYALRDLGYEMKVVDELGFIKDYSECKLLVVASPKQKYSDLLKSKMEEYLLKDRPILMSLDPAKKHGLGAWIRKFGIRHYNNYVLDFAGEKAGFNVATVIGSNWNKNLKLGRWLSKKATVFAVASKLEAIDPVYENFEVNPLVSSSPNSFTKMELQSNIQFKPGIDEEGSFPIGILSEKNNAKLAVFSDGDFLTNEYFNFQGNRELSIQLVSYLIHSEGDISVPRKHFYREMFVLTPIWAKTYLITAVLPIPFLLLAASLWLFLKRRREDV